MLYIVADPTNRETLTVTEAVRLLTGSAGLHYVLAKVDQRTGAVRTMDVVNDGYVWRTLARQLAETVPEPDLRAFLTRAGFDTLRLFGSGREFVAWLTAHPALDY